MLENNLSAINKHKGFNLIELMVVVSIIGILATIAIPAYSTYVKQGKAARATSSLSDMRIKFEQYFQDKRTYVGFSCPVPEDSGQSFNYSCGTATATTYTLTASGIADMVNFTYTINQANAKTSNYDGGGLQNCWTTKKGQTC